MPDVARPVTAALSHARCPACGSELPPGGDPGRAGGSCGSTVGPPPPPPPAETLPPAVGRFVVEARLGRGSFGTVYRARDPELGRAVAVKVPRAGAFPDDEHRKQFAREAKAAARLRHPGIVTVYEVAAHDELPVIVSEYVAGTTLAERIAANRPGFRESAALVAAVADALDHAHRAGVVHRDVKPSNVLLDAEGRPHLADFGLALGVDPEATVTAEGDVIGTPAYMSPEQAAGKPGVDGRADVYSLGVILYELLTGERPFRGNPRMLVAQVQFDDPRPPRAVDDRIPRDLETVCLKCLAKPPGKRYATAGALAADLRRWLAGEPVLARRAGRGERFARWGRRNPTVASLLGLLAVVIVASLAGLGFLLNRAEQRRARAEALLTQASDADAAGQSVLNEFVLDELLAGFPADTDPAAVRERLAGLVARAHARFETQPGLLAAALNFLANGYAALAARTDDPADAAAAGALYREALDRRLAAFGPDHPATLQSTNNHWLHVGRFGTDAGKQQAECGLWRCWQDCRRALGPDYSLTLTVHHNRAWALYQTRDFAAAEAECRLCLAEQLRVRGPGYPQEFQTRDLLCDALAAQGPDGRRAALPLRAELRDSTRRQFGRDGWQAVQAAREYAALELDLGNPAAAVEPMKDALDAEAHGRTVLPQLKATHRVLYGWALLDAGRAEAAIPVLNEAVAMRRELPAAGGWPLGYAEVLLGAALGAKGESTDAEELLRAGYRRMRDDPAANRDRLRASWDRADRLFTSWNRPDLRAAWAAEFPRPQ